MNFDLAIANLVSPLVLCFVLGCIAAWVRSDLKLPDALFQGLAVYLMLSIGLKGGVALAQAELARVWPSLLAALVMAAIVPVWTFLALRRLAKFPTTDAAALAAHYGSVSAVTFIATLTYLENAGVAYEGYVSSWLAIMEAPAVVFAIGLAQASGNRSVALSAVAGRLLSLKSIVLLLGGLLIGALVGPRGFQPVKPLFVDLFQGLLCLFLLEIGIQAAGRMRELRKAAPALISFAVLAPLVNGVVALALAKAVGLSLGGAVVFATLAASSSYIVAPAAIRTALPDANPSLYLTASLGVTFPFNLFFGLPIYFWLARMLYA